MEHDEAGTHRSPPGSRSGPTVSPSLRVGEILRQTREAKGITLEELEARTHIRVSYLRALESGEFEQLPGMTFTTGFIRLCARQLELPGEELVAQVRAHLQDEYDQLDFTVPTDQRLRPRLGLVAGGVLLFIVALVAFDHLPQVRAFLGAAVDLELLALDLEEAGEPDGGASRPAAEKAAPKVARPAPASPPAPAASPDVTVESAATAEAALSPEEGPPPEDEEGETPEPTPLPAATSAPPAPSASTTLTGEELTQLAGKPVTLIALERVWVRVRGGDNRIIKEAVLKKGEQYTPAGKGPFFAAIGNAGGVQFQIGEKVLPPLGATGQVINKIALDPETLSKPYVPPPP